MARDSTSFIELLGLARIQVRARVGNGQVSERGLALRTGISQPYLHRVLKGARPMPPEMADRLMRELSLTMADLTVPRIGPGSEAPAVVQDRKRASR